MRTKALVWLAMCLLGASALVAQTTSTTMFGSVTDEIGATIAGAEITVRNDDTGLSRNVRTNSQGEYRVEFLPVGNYSVEINATGFRKFIRKGIVLQVDQTARI